MENVYVLSVVRQFDVGDFGQEVRTFSNIDSALDEMKKQMERGRKMFKGMETDEDDYCESDMSWSIWEKGEYAFNHFDVMIIECEVEQ